MRDPNSVTLVLGGARSGKSRYAQALAAAFDEVIFVASATPVDNEMSAKIARHQADRPAAWTTVEEPLHLAEALGRVARDHPKALVLLDCLTLWTANLLHAHGSNHTQATADALEASIASLLTALEHNPNPIILVSNEVGNGIVPAYPLGRRYRDLLGEINQRVAAVANDVVLLVAGLPLPLKHAGSPVHSLSHPALNLPGSAPAAAP